jgi:hypothetical protein
MSKKKPQKVVGEIIVLLKLQKARRKDYSETCKHYTPNIQPGRGNRTQNIHEIRQLACLLILLQLDVELAQSVEGQLVHVDVDHLRLQDEENASTIPRRIP